MRFGNRGHNQPVLALASSGSIKAGRVFITSQNHRQYLQMTAAAWPDALPRRQSMRWSSVTRFRRAGSRSSSSWPSRPALARGGSSWISLLCSCNDSSVEGIKSSDASGRKVWGCVPFSPSAQTELMIGPLQRPIPPRSCRCERVWSMACPQADSCCCIGGPLDVMGMFVSLSISPSPVFCGADRLWTCPRPTLSTSAAPVAVLEVSPPFPQPRPLQLPRLSPCVPECSSALL